MGKDGKEGRKERKERGGGQTDHQNENENEGVNRFSDDEMDEQTNK